MSVQLVALLANVLLALMKFLVGELAGSRALIADAFNSAGDVLATGIAWWAFRLGLRPPDENHHYGHANAEAIAGMLIGGMLCATGMFIAIDGLLGVIEDRGRDAPEPLAMWAAGATIVVKEILYRASMRVGRRTGSPTLLASARDHRADVVSALVALVGVFVARNGLPIIDTLAGMAIGLYIFSLGFEPVRENIGILMHEAPPELAEAAARRAREVEGVEDVRQVRVLPTGGRFRMDMVLSVAGEVSVARGHEIAHAAERAVRATLERIDEVYVHVEPR